MTSNIKTIDPVQGLVDYVLDIKPYHTKIVEVLVEHVGEDSIEVTMTDQHEMEFDFFYSKEYFDLLPCDDGFGTLSFGTSRTFPVVSPTPSVAFDAFPAIDSSTNSFIVLDNKIPDFDIGSTVYLYTYIEDLIVDLVTSFSYSETSVIADDAVTFDTFGSAVDISVDGTFAVVGARTGHGVGVNGEGAAYVFTNSGGTWTQQQKIVASDGLQYDGFGYSVSIDGTGSTCLVSAPYDDIGFSNVGSVYFFTRSGSTWTQQQKIVSASVQESDIFGTSISLSTDGNTCIIGAPGTDPFFKNGAGAAYIFTKSGGVWSEQQRIIASDNTAGDQFGTTVDINDDGTVIVVGSYHGVYVFTESGGTWSEQQKLTGSDVEVGPSGPNIGYTVSVDGTGTTLVTGSYDVSLPIGQVRIFTESGGVWSEQQKISASDADPLDDAYFGTTVSINNDATLIAATSLKDNGVVYIIDNIEGTWTENQQIVGAGVTVDDFFGESLSIGLYDSIDVVMIGLGGDNVKIRPVYFEEIFTSGSVSVAGDQTSYYISPSSSPVSTVSFEIIDSTNNNGTYTVTSSTYDGTNTVISVNEPLLNSSTLGFVKIPGNNTGFYTVLSTSYDGGSIDSWSDVTDPSTYDIGNSPYTDITVVEPLNPVPTLYPNQAYVAYVTNEPLPVVGVLSYSNILRKYQYSPLQISQTPDEGYIYKSVVGATISTLDGTGQPISDSGKFVVSGNLNESNIFVGRSLRVLNTSLNDGVYTITTLNYNSLTDTTTIGVAELVEDDTVEGYLTINVPANVIIVSGNHQSRFIQGDVFNVVGGSVPGKYTVLNSQYITTEDVTWIRVIEDVLPSGIGDYILSSNNTVGSPSYGQMVVSGNVTSKYTTNKTVLVFGTSTNNGQYTVSSSSYDSGSDTTTIIFTDVVDVQTAGGYIDIFAMGIIKPYSYGYSESSNICGHVPDTVVDVRVDERIYFSGLGLDLSDDIIAYNLENTDTWGYDLPYNTIFSTTSPSVPEQSSTPISPTLNDLWFDTSNNLFKQWDGYYWKNILKVYWHDTINSLMYYRIKNSLVDTGWVLDFPAIPGYSDYIPAVGKKQVINTDTFMISDTSSTTFTLTQAIPSTGSPAVIDSTYLKVEVNNLPVDVTILSTTQFTIDSVVVTGDVVVAKVYDDVGTETNAFVSTFDNAPHVVFHRTVTVDTTNDAFVVNGGNFIERFAPDNTFTGMDVANATTKGNWTANTFPIVSVGTTGSPETIETISVNGSYSWLFTTGRVFRVGLTPSTFIDFVVDTSSESGSPLITTITVTNTVYYNDIFSNNSLGYVYGAVYDSTANPQGSPINSAYSTNQPKTIVVPTNTTDSNVSGIVYDWVGPMRMYTNIFETDVVSSTFIDGLGATDQLLSAPDRFTIIDTNMGATPSFVISYTDPSTGTPIDLGSIFTPGYIFDVANSYLGDTPSSFESNDAKYVVASTSFDWSGSPASGTGYTTIYVDTDFNNIPPYNSFTVIDITNQAGSPYNGNTITLSGNHVTLLSSFPTQEFKFDQPIVAVEDRYNVIQATNVELVGGNTVITTSKMFIDENYTGTIGIIEAVYNNDIYYDESTGIGSPTQQWHHGEIIREALRIDNVPENITSASIVDTISFGWGTTYQWQILDANSTSSTIYIDTDITSLLDPNDRVQIKGSENIDGEYEIQAVTYNGGSGQTEAILTNPALSAEPTGSPKLCGYLELSYVDITDWFQYLIKELNANNNTIEVVGDATSQLQTGQQLRVMGTLSNDGIYTLNASPSYNSNTDITTVSVTETISFGENDIIDIIGSNIIRASGNAAQYLDGEDFVYIVNSTFNDGLYVVQSVEYDSVNDVSDILVLSGSPTLNSTADGTLRFYQRGGWIESWKFIGINLVFDDLVGIGVTESVGAIETTGGMLIGALDYPGFDVGSFDESIDTVMLLYSGTFSS